MSGLGQSRARRLGPLLILSTLIGVLASQLEWPLVINGDEAMYLQAGQLLLAGKRPYYDFIELNPPMIMYLNVVPAALARFSPFHPVTTCTICLWLVMLASAFGTRAVLGRQPAASAWAADAVALALCLVHALVYFEDNVGTREYLFIAAAVPYLALRFVRVEGAETGGLLPVLIGVLAGATACFKPHFVAVLLAGEAYLYFTRRRPFPFLPAETLALVVTGTAFVAHFLLLPSQVRGEFLGRWMPFVSAHYAVYNAPWRDVLTKSMLLGPLACAAAFAFTRSQETPVARLTRLFGVVALAATVTAIVQHKGWNVHAIPSDGASLVVVLLLCGAWLEGKRFDPLRARLVMWAVPVAATALMLTAGGALLSGWRALAGTPLQRINGSDALALWLTNATRPGDRVAVLDTSVFPGYPALVQAQRLPGTRYLWTFPIAMFRDPDSQASGGASSGEAPSNEERRFLSELTTDLQFYRPAAILVQAHGRCQGCPPDFTVRRYLRTNGVLGEQFVSDYRFVGSYAQLAVYLRRE